MTRARRLRPGAGAAARSPAIARARLTIDLDAIAANWRALDALSGPAVETAAVVKADAYGLGAARVGAGAGGGRGAQLLRGAGRGRRRACGRRSGPGPAIYVFAGPDARATPRLCREHDLIPCLNSAAQVA